MQKPLIKISVIMEFKNGVKYAEERGGFRREWTVPCEVLKETKGGMIKVKEFRDGAEFIKYVPKSKLIEL